MKIKRDFTTTDPSIDTSALEANNIQSRILYKPIDDENLLYNK